MLRRLSPTVIWSTAVYSMYTYLGDGLTSLGLLGGGNRRGAPVLWMRGDLRRPGRRAHDRSVRRQGDERDRARRPLLCLLLTRLALDVGVLVDCAFGLSSAVAQLFFPAQQAQARQ